VLRELGAKQKQREETEQDATLAVQEKHLGDVMVAVQAWPGQLQDDLHALTMLELSDDENESVNDPGTGTGQAYTSYVPVDAMKPTTSKFEAPADEIGQGRIRHVPSDTHPQAAESGAPTNETEQGHKPLVTPGATKPSPEGTLLDSIQISQHS